MNKIFDFIKKIFSKKKKIEPFVYPPAHFANFYETADRIVKPTIGLLEFAKKTIKELEQIKDGDFAAAFVKAKVFCFHNYQNGLVTSNSHGLSYFENIVKYWDDPDSYYTPLDKKNNPISMDKREKLVGDYEYNFIKILKANK